MGSLLRLKVQAVRRAVIIAGLFTVSATCTYNIFSIEYGADTALWFSMAMAAAFLFLLWLYGFFYLRFDPKSMVGPWVRGGVLMLFFGVSGYGVVTFLSAGQSAPTVIKDSIEGAFDGYEKLKVTAADHLKDTDYVALKNRLDGDLFQLKSEIYNPTGNQYCGVGNNAKKIIASIGTYLNGFAFLNGTDSGHNCEDTPYLDGIYSTYERSAYFLLQRHPVVQASKQVAINTFNDDLRQVASTHDAALNSLIKRLSGLAPMEWVFSDYALFTDAKLALEAAARDYRHLYERALNLSTELKKSDVFTATPTSIEASTLQVLSGPLGGLLYALHIMMKHINFTPLFLSLIFFPIDLFATGRYRKIIDFYIRIRTAVDNATIMGTDVDYLLGCFIAAETADHA